MFSPFDERWQKNPLVLKNIVNHLLKYKTLIGYNFLSKMLRNEFYTENKYSYNSLYITDFVMIHTLPCMSVPIILYWLNNSKDEMFAYAM